MLEPVCNKHKCARFLILDASGGMRHQASSGIAETREDRERDRIAVSCPFASVF